MKPESTADILDLMLGYIPAAALGAAMELGVFWLLAEKPLPAAEVARSLEIPLNRCRHWLEILCGLGLLEQGSAGYAPSLTARETILDALSRDTWAFQAREDRDAAVWVRDLAEQIREPASTRQGGNGAPPDYFQRLQDDPGYAARFTRKLYEIHLALADQVAAMLDLQGVNSLLDLGGGSGVVSLALLRKQPDLTSVVVDVENVCRAGREIAAENGLERRVTYRTADILQDDLPSGFDMVLLCDVGLYSDVLWRRIDAALNPRGRLVIVDKFAPSPTGPPPSRLPAAFLDALAHPAPAIDLITAQRIRGQLQQAGFRDVSIAPVPHQDDLPWNLDWIMLKAEKDGGKGDG